LFSNLSKDKQGQHQQNRFGQGHERTYETKQYEYGDPFNLDLQRTIRNALRRGGQGTPVKLSPEDFEIEQTEHLTRSSTVLMLDASYSMVRDGRWGPAKKVAVALQSLMSSQYPRDYLGVLMFGHVAWEIKADELIEASLTARHQHASRTGSGPQNVESSNGQQADHHDHRRRADGTHHPAR
jgi:uncharacterized protein with von Willebrand factor type A (vWA) domain